MNRWVEGLTNWQYVALTAGVIILGLVLAACIAALTSGNLHLRFLITFGAAETIVLTSVSAWRRWK